MREEAFFTLVRAGLWGDVNTNENLSHNSFENVDWGELHRLAEEQSVIGLIADAIDRFKAQVPGFKIPQEWALQFIGATLQIEQLNKAMNAFVAELIERLRKADIYAILVKGQGLAQCYEEPLWRASGDVDLLLSDTNYEKAKELLVPLTSDVETEYTHFKHLGMTIDGWVVELHGTLHSRLSKRVDNVVDEVQREVFFAGKVRSIEFKSSSSSSVQVFLPAPDEDVVFVFTHILHHFFFEGIGLRQICDWCRLLWTYRDAIDLRTLELRLRKAGLMSEWKAFYALATKYLGMPEVSGFMFQDSRTEKWEKKADRIMAFVMEVGNFGHNKELKAKNCRTKKQSYFWRKFISFWGRLSGMLRHFRIFPLDSIRFFGGVLRSGLHAVARGE